MRKLILKATLSVGCVLVFILLNLSWSLRLVGSPPEGVLVVSPEIREDLAMQLSKSFTEYSLDLEEAKKIDKAFRGWVSGSINFNKVKEKKSKIFKKRVFYYQETEKNIPRFIKKRPDKRGLKNIRPIQMFYRISPNRFSFRKLLDAKAEVNIEKKQAIKIIRNFLLKNNFLRINEFDKPGEIRLRELRGNYDSGNDSPGKDVLIMQGVNFSREFMGVPVINSKITVDFHPDTEEILGFKHYNWTPVKQRTRVSIPKEKAKSLEDVLGNLNQRVRSYCGSSEKARLEKVTSAWFQTETKVVPILVCQIVVEQTVVEDMRAHRHIEYINLVGNDDVFYLKEREVNPVKPKDAPK